MLLWKAANYFDSLPPSNRISFSFSSHTLLNNQPPGVTLGQVGSHRTRSLWESLEQFSLWKITASLKVDFTLSFTMKAVQRENRQEDEMKRR